jgi:hypothetical protein
MAKPVFRAITGPAVQSASTTWTIAKPTGVVSGDVMLATFSYEGPSSSVTGGTVPSGWTIATTPAAIGWPHAGVIYYKVAGGSEPSSYTWTLTTAESGVSRIVAYSSVDTTTPIHAASAIVAPSDGSPPYQYATDALTTLVPDCLLFAHFSMLTATSTTWTASGMTERGDLYAGAEVTSDAAYELVPVPAGTYTKTGAATSNGAAQGVEVTILALKPFPSPPAAPVNTSAPVASGNATVTFEVTATDGEWTGDPTPQYTYQWQRNTGSGFTNIGSATSATYTLQAADELALVRCLVTATNATAAVAHASSELGPVEAEPPPPDCFLLVGEGWAATAGRIMTSTGWVPPP